MFNEVPPLRRTFKKLCSFLPSGLEGMTQDVKKNLHGCFQSTLSGWGFITREAFDIQSEVLARTREKLEDLEKTLQSWEEKLNTSSSTSSHPKESHSQED